METENKYNIKNHATFIEIAFALTTRFSDYETKDYSFDYYASGKTIIREKNVNEHYVYKYRISDYERVEVENYGWDNFLSDVESLDMTDEQLAELKHVLDDIKHGRLKDTVRTKRYFIPFQGFDVCIDQFSNKKNKLFELEIELTGGARDDKALDYIASVMWQYGLEKDNRNKLTKLKEK